MVTIKWTIQGLEDVESIANFIDRDSTYYAGMFSVKVFEAIERLELFPESGRIVPEFNCQEIREIILGNYRIIYRIKQDIVEILTVYHSARLLETDKIEKSI